MKTVNDILNKKLKDYNNMILLKRLKNYYPNTYFSFVLFEFIIIVTTNEYGFNLTVFNFLLKVNFKRRNKH